MSIFGFKRWMHWSVGEWSALKRALATHAVVSEVGGAGEIVCL